MHNIFSIYSWIYKRSVHATLFNEFMPVQRRVCTYHMSPSACNTLSCEPFLFLDRATCAAVCPDESFCVGTAPSSRSAAMICGSPVLAAVWIGYFVFNIVRFGTVAP